MSASNIINPGAPMTDQETKLTFAPTDPWNNAYALKVVNGDFDAWSSYRQINHDKRWVNSDQLFVAWQPQRVWEGTRVPRSSIGVPLLLEQEETLLANVMQALFPLEDNVNPVPRFGTTMYQARLSMALIMEQLRQSYDGYSDIRETVRKAIKQGFLYGNGILEVSWEYCESVINIAVPAWQQSPIYDQLQASIYGSVPKRRLTVKKLPIVKNQPLIDNIDIRDFYIDPSTPGPDIQKASGVCVRSLVPRSKIKEYEGQQGFDVPPDAILEQMSNEKSSTVGDQSKQQGESYRGVNYQPINDYTGSPGEKRIELLRYFTKDRVIWVLNRKWVMYNDVNPFGFIPFLNAFYIDYPSRFYGISLADVVEPEQRLQQSIINARIDELALTIHAPFVKKRGDQLPQNSMRMVPGKVIELDYPDQFKKIDWPNITQQSFIEVSASSARNQKATGLSDVGAVGGPTDGGNSANRTATGINQQMAVTSRRIGFIVENIENTFIEPLFEMIHRMNRIFLNPDQPFYLIGHPQAVDPLAIIHADVRFRATAGKKMQSRAMILQVMPQLLPLILNPSVMEQMAMQQGLTLDMKEVMDSIADALNVPPMAWWRPMNPQEMQQNQQMNPNVMKAQTAMQMQSQRLQAQGEHQEAKGDTELLKSIISEVIKNPKLQGAATGYPLPEPKNGNQSAGA